MDTTRALKYRPARLYYAIHGETWLVVDSFGRLLGLLRLLLLSVEVFPDDAAKQWRPVVVVELVKLGE